MLFMIYCLAAPILDKSAMTDAAYHAMLPLPLEERQVTLRGVLDSWSKKIDLEYVFLATFDTHEQRKEFHDLTSVSSYDITYKPKQSRVLLIFKIRESGLAPLVLDLCNLHVADHLRRLGNQLYMLLKMFGLQPLFAGWREEAQADKSFILTK